MSLNPYYTRGYTNGRLDRLLGAAPMVVALTSWLPGYASGYYDGYHGLPAKP